MKSRKSSNRRDLSKLTAQQSVTQNFEGKPPCNTSLSYLKTKLHGSDRDSLVTVGERGFQNMSQYLQQTLTTTPTEPEKRLKAIGIAYVQYAIAHPGEYQIMFHTSLENEKKYSDIAKAATKAFSILVKIITEGQKVGVFRLGNAKELAKVTWSLVHGLSMLLIDGQLKVPKNSSVEVLASYTTQMLSQGIKIQGEY